MQKKILVVDDEENIVKTLCRALELEGFATQSTPSGERALEILNEEIVALAIIDIRLQPGGIDGMTLLEEMKKRWPEILVIVISGHGTIELALKATQQGAYYFIEKPIVIDKLLITIRNAFRYSSLKEEHTALQQKFDHENIMIGSCRAMQEVFRKIELAAPTFSRVLITGENGTGKELVARALHRTSMLKDNPFIKVNCAAIHPDLIESELFGHEKGSFTGAIHTHIGKFELADGGTLFLDEIGDMHANTQAKVLRILQEGEFERVGGNRTIKVNVRIIAATNKELQKEIEAGRFREDLYYRINVIPIEVPPLRNRTEDIPLLLDFFLDILCQENGKVKKSVSEAAIQLLQEHTWPGNIRELRNFVERLVILTTNDSLSAQDIRLHLPKTSISGASTPQGTSPLKQQVLQFEKNCILSALEQNRWHITNTAKKLDIERSHLYKKIKQHDISLKSEEVL